MVGSDGTWNGSNDIRYVESSTKPFKRAKRKVGVPIEYQPIDYEHIENDEGWADEELGTQIRETVTTLDKKKLRSGDEVFFILDFKFDPSNPEVRNLLKKLKANIIAYLNKEHNRVLVSASNDALRAMGDRDIPKYVHHSLYMLRPLSAKDQLSESLRTDDSDKQKLLLFNIMPNVEAEKQSTYLQQLENRLREYQCPIYESVLKELGVIVTDASAGIAQSIAEDSTFVYHVGEAPLALAMRIREERGSKPSLKKSKKGIGVPQSVEITSSGQAPIVVVMDSGVDSIPQLMGVVTNDGYQSFTDYGDGFTKEEGHGTPICYLIAYGERETLIPAKIISYKVFSLDKQKVAYDGIISGIRKYSQSSRLFLSSIGLEGIHPYYVALLDKEVQRRNVMFVCAAGNISKEMILDSFRNGRSYPSYLKSFDIMPPSTGVNIIGVSSLARKEIQRNTTEWSISRPGLLSPHSRCGNSNPRLYECKKPEVVEHGGNLNYLNGVLSEKNVGVMGIERSGKETDSLTGTSFSAPLFMRKMMLLQAKWGSMIKNVETLKAMTFLSCKNVQGFDGYGEASMVKGLDQEHAMYISEGEIPLEDKISDKDFRMIFRNKTDRMKIPKGIGRIDVCIVHSDNFAKLTEPTLATYLEVEMWKTGSDSKVSPKMGRPDAKTNIKLLTYSFDTHSMEADWWLNITPQPTAPMLPEELKNTTVRFGCAVLLSRKSKHQSIYSVNDQIAMG